MTSRGGGTSSGFKEDKESLIQDFKKWKNQGDVIVN